MAIFVGSMQRLFMRLSQLGSGEQGAVLVIVLIITAVVPLITFGFMNLAGTSFQVATTRADLMRARYAAETGVSNVVSDLLEGTDARSLGYTVPAPVIGEFPVTITVGAPTTGAEPSPVYQYIDPGVGFGLQSLSAQTHYFLTIDNVQSGSGIRMNWAFTPVRQRWKTKLYDGLGPTALAAPTIIAQDNLESGDFSGGSGWVSPWATQGDSSVVSSGGPYEGTYHMQLRRGNGLVERGVDLSGQTDVRLQFQAKASSFDAGETATCSVSTDGVAFTVVRIWEDGEDDDVYRFEDIDLSSFAMTSTFEIACASNMSGPGDLFFVDDLKVISQVVPDPIAETSSTKGPGELFISGDGITTGQYTFDFFNDSGTDLVSGAFSTSGDANDTWIFAQAHKDYVITSTADNTTITGYARQIPGPTEPDIRERIFLESWEE